jgi:GT2 family glycosyltransferase
MTKTSVVVPNWNGRRVLPACLDSLLAQSLEAKIIVVDNASSDGSQDLLQETYPLVEVVSLAKNKGFAGGVNAGIKRAIELGADYVALLNNDAVADKNWLQNMANALEKNSDLGIVTSKICDAKKTHLDSTGENYSVWGLPYPRGRGEADIDKYDRQTVIFGASGGASLYRIKMLQQIGLFDEDFFAYYEDVDLSFRAQLAGWKVNYVPGAVAYHEIGATSGKIKGFTTYQTLKNLPLLLWKNVPWALMPRIWPRLVIAYSAFLLSALWRGQFWAIIKGLVMGTIYWPKKLVERYRIQKNRKVSASYINSLIIHDLPPAAKRLRRARSIWWSLIGRNSN